MWDLSHFHRDITNSQCGGITRSRSNNCISNLHFALQRRTFLEKWASAQASTNDGEALYPSPWTNSQWGSITRSRSNNRISNPNFALQRGKLLREVSMCTNINKWWRSVTYVTLDSACANFQTIGYEHKGCRGNSTSQNVFLRHASPPTSSQLDTIDMASKMDTKYMGHTMDIIAFIKYPLTGTKKQLITLSLLHLTTLTKNGYHILPPPLILNNCCYLLHVCKTEPIWNHDLLAL